MPKKKNDKLEKQLTIRMSQEAYDRIEKAAITLGIDSSGLVRMMCYKSLPEFERQARELETGKQDERPCKSS